MSRIPLALVALLLFTPGTPADEPTHDGKPLSEWVKQLGSPEKETRDKAETAIRTLSGNADAVTESLIAAAAQSASPVPELRMLIELGPRAVPGLTAALWSPDERTRRFGLLAIAR